MSDALLLLIARMAAAMVNVVGRRLPPARREELVAVVRAACADAGQRYGIAGIAAAAFMELLDLALMPFRQRFGIGPHITTSSGVYTIRPGGGYAMILDDVRRAFRRLKVSAATVTLAMTMLALAIGVTGAMFTVLDALVLRPVPFRDADRLVRVVEGLPGGRRLMSTTPPEVVEAWRTSGAFEQIEGAVQGQVVIDTGGEPIERRGARITPPTLRMLGVQPMLGRDFADGEGRTGTDDRLLISEELWTSLFARDPRVIGRRVRLSGETAEIVGVMPAGFRFPAVATAIWQPIDLAAPPPALERVSVSAFARLPAGVPRRDVMRRADQSLQTTDARRGPRETVLRPVAAGMVDAYSRQAVTALSTAVGLVFFVLCANAMNLMLTRFTSRHREFAICATLGAPRYRLVREALAEAAMIGVGGFLFGLLLTKALVAVSAYLLPEALLTTTLTPVAVSWRTVAVTSALGLVATGIAALAPAWTATKLDPAKALHPSQRGASTGGGRRLARSLLVAEIAMATTLLACAALLVRTFTNLAGAERGLDADGVVTGWVSLPSFDFREPAVRVAFAAAMEDSVRKLPGIRQVSLSHGVPPGSAYIFFGELHSEGREVTLSALKTYFVGPGFFDLFRVPVLAGRTFSGLSAPTEVVIGERLASLLWPDGGAVGRSFRMGSSKGMNTVVGVVKEIRNPSSDPRLDPPEVYFPLFVEQGGQMEPSGLSRGQIFVAMRCGAACPPLPQIRDAIHAAGARAVIAELGPLDDEYSKMLARPRAAAMLGAAFGLIALAAAAGGMFGVLSASVGRRRREYGIRAALGIEPCGLRWLVFRDACVLTGSGLIVGAFGAWTFGRALASITFEVTPADPRSWAAVSLALAGLVICAAWVPAARAASADPTTLLRDE